MGTVLKTSVSGLPRLSLNEICMLSTPTGIFKSSSFNLHRMHFYVRKSDEERLSGGVTQPRAVKCFDPVIAKKYFGGHHEKRENDSLKVVEWCNNQTKVDANLSAAWSPQWKNFDMMVGELELLIKGIYFVPPASRTKAASWVCFAKGPRPRKPRVWKSRTKAASWVCFAKGPRPRKPSGFDSWLGGVVFCLKHLFVVLNFVFSHLRAVIFCICSEISDILHMFRAAMEALRMQLERLQRPIDLVQTLHDRQLKEIPARYILPCDQRPSLALAAQHSIPVINLAADHSEAVAQVAQASQEWGFFQILNHGIPQSLLESIKGLSQEFFDLPLEEKRRQCPPRPGTNMLEGYGRFFDISDDTVLDWVDALVHYISPPSVKAVEHWPQTPLTYRETYEKYGEEVLRLTEKLLGLLSEGLGLDSNYVQTLIKEPLLQLRINYYPPCPQPDLVNGLRPHSDGSVVTVLLDDQVEGLQVRKDKEWFTVSPVPGALVVNVGDILQIISNGKYKSAEHRAVANTNQYRKTIVMFLCAQVDAMIAPAAELIDEAHPSLYQSVISGEYGASYMSKDIRGKTAVEALLTEQK